MKKESVIKDFFETFEKDYRLGISHIGLYITLRYLWEKQGCNGPVIAFGKEVMQLSRIGSTATYQKLIRQLAHYGYLQYKPSLYKGRGSRIFLNPVSSIDCRLNNQHDEGEPSCQAGNPS